MTRILLWNVGPHSQASRGYLLAREAIAVAGIADAQITERDLVKSPLPPIGRDYVLALTSRPGNDEKAFE